MTIEHIDISSPGLGPTNFLKDNYDIIHNIQKLKETTRKVHNTQLQFIHIYSYLEDPQKETTS